MKKRTDSAVVLLFKDYAAVDYVLFVIAAAIRVSQVHITAKESCIPSQVN